MEQKKINYTLLFSLIIFAIGICVKGLAGFLGGAFGLPFVATLVMFALVLLFGLSSADVRKRVVDIIALDIVVVLFSLVLYCMIDWSKSPSVDLINFAHVWLTIYSVFSLLFFAYALFRFLCEKTGKKIKFVEVLLGFEKYEKKPKDKQKPAKVSKENKRIESQDKPLKEVMNGDLEDKPLNEEKQNQSTENDDNADNNQYSNSTTILSKSEDSQDNQ